MATPLRPAPKLPELDRFAWLELAEARRLIVRGQVALVEELEKLLAD